jgi:hypothetical protein
MNENTPVPPRIPPQIPSSVGLSEPRPLGDDPVERAAIPHVFAAIEALLRQPRRLLFQLRQPGAGKLIVAMLFTAFICSLIYGVVAGTFSGGTQLWAAPIKIAAGLMISAAICLPSLYIFTCLSGSHARLIEVGGPLHLIFWLVATLFGVRFMKAGFTHANAKSQAGLNVWIVIFLLVALQMTTALRPIIGKSDTFFPTEKKFFLGHWGDCLRSQPGDSKTNARD